MKEWLWPLALGLVAAAGVFLVDPTAAPAASELEPHVVPVFADGPVGTQPRDVLVVADGARPPVVEVAPGLNATPRYIGPVGLVRAEACACPPGPYVLAAPPEHAPRALQDGHVGVEATIYVFDDEGLLMTTNAPYDERSRFRLYEDFFAMPHAVWHIGEGETPPGMQELPLFRDEARRLVANETVGAHMAARFEAHKYADIVGPVTVAIRVDALVQAA